MKFIYKKPLIFPTWARFDSKNAGKQFHNLSKNGIEFLPKKDILPYFNHIEMTGFEMSSIISYKIDKNAKLKLYLFCVFPQIRVIPNETRGSLTYHFKNIDIGVCKAKKTVSKVIFDGTLRFEEQGDDVKIVHEFSPGYDKKALIEKIEVENLGTEKRIISVKNNHPTEKIRKCFIVENKEQYLYTRVFSYDGRSVDGNKEFVISPRQQLSFTVFYGAEQISFEEANRQAEKRKTFLEQSNNRLKITTPDININRMTDFCKIRTSESIFNTKNGLMHAPGGGNFYGALWTNDQCEYANPLFAYLGYAAGIEQSLNCYGLYSQFASDNKAIPTSIIACGDDIWNGAGDRGDTSMYLYGLSRFLLSTGDREKAARFLPYIKKATEYVISNITDDFIVKSDSDELENRFKSGKANLSTSCITYDAFVSLGHLYRELGDEKESQRLFALSQNIKAGIENYFGSDVEGYKTYRYCEEETNLRSWICLPLTVGIFERKDDTINALLSNRLYKNGGFLTRSGDKTYWDRSALYAMRGLFYSGEADKACRVLSNYTKERLLGCHIPYPVEAFPEGNSAQLSAESALYLRIITEGILGYRPVGFDSFEVKPNLPSKWDKIQISNITLFGKAFSISVQNGDVYTVQINDSTVKINKGEKYIYTESR
ncbi:MAG: hypothetical protein ACI4IN_05970 [Eubacterium sp.]